MKLNHTILAIQPSATLAIASLARQMAQQGHQVCNFSAGEPDFDTPDFIKEACCEALRKGQTKYTPVNGIPRLCELIAAKLKRENNINYMASQIIVSCGAKHSLALVFQTLLNPGDEVLVPSPFWLSYPEMIRVAGGVPVLVRATRENDFKVMPADLQRAATKRTVALVINSPCNPTGIMYTPSEIRSLGEMALQLGLTVVSDEIYEKMVYDGNQQVSLAALSPQLYDHTITVNGFSKAYSMTGWRLGYTAGPVAFIQAMGALQSHCASAPTTFAQCGAIAALEKGDDSIAQMVKAFDERRQRIFALMSAIPGVKCPRPTGAFYIFPDISSFGLDSVTFAKRLLAEQKVAVVPGVAFDADACVRLSYACSLAEIESGLSRFAAFCASLR
ncbi:MAG: pyridoxal phosphate-dependent aminotransferase [bacterium]